MEYLLKGWTIQEIKLFSLSESKEDLDYFSDNEMEIFLPVNEGFVDYHGYYWSQQAKNGKDLATGMIPKYFAGYDPDDDNCVEFLSEEDGGVFSGDFPYIPDEKVLKELIQYNGGWLFKPKFYPRQLGFASRKDIVKNFPSLRRYMNYLVKSATINSQLR